MNKFFNQLQLKSRTDNHRHKKQEITKVEMEPIKEMVLPNTLFNPDKNWKEYELYFKLKDLLSQTYTDLSPDPSEKPNIETYLKNYIEIIRDALNIDTKSLLNLESMMQNSSESRTFICDEFVENLTNYFMDLINNIMGEHHRIVDEMNLQQDNMETRIFDLETKVKGQSKLIKDFKNKPHKMPEKAITNFEKVFGMQKIDTRLNRSDAWECDPLEIELNRSAITDDIVYPPSIEQRLQDIQSELKRIKLEINLYNFDLDCEKCELKYIFKDEEDTKEDMLKQSIKNNKIDSLSLQINDL